MLPSRLLAGFHHIEDRRRKTGTGAGLTPPTTHPETPPPVLKQQKPFPPDDWTHKELAEYLGTKGVKVKVVPYTLHSQPGRIVAGFHDREAEAVEVGVTLCATEEKAREEAGAMGEGAFYRRRFAFGAAPNAKEQHLLKRIAEAMK